MGTTIISVECIDQSLNIKKKPLIASGGIKVDTIEFTFCALWDGFSKVAVFYRNKREVYHVEICDDKCTIPKEVLVNPGYLYFGVFGVKDGVTRTSSIISYKVEAGAITDGINPPEPTPSIYEKILKQEEDRVEAEAARAKAESERVEAVSAIEKRLDDLAAVAKSGSYNDLTDKPTIPVVPSTLPNPQPITINGQRYDGSEAVTVTVSSEGGGTPVEIDDTLTQSGKAADAKVVGDKLNKLNEANAAQDAEIAKKANVEDLATVAKTGAYSDLTGTPTIPTVPSSLPNPNALTFTGAVEETYDGSAAKSVAIPAVPESLKNPNKLILSGAVTAEYDGSSEVSVEIPAGGGSAYELPIASATKLGGVQPVAKTDEMTQPVGVDALGALFTAPGGGVGWDGKWRLIKTISVSADVSQEIFSTDDNGNEFSLTEILIYASQLPSMNSGYLYVRYMNAEGFHSNNNSIWPSNGKTLKWYLSIRDSLLKTDIAISDNKIIGEYDTASMSADSIERMAVGASAGFTEDGTIYVYGR